MDGVIGSQVLLSPLKSCQETGNAPGIIGNLFGGLKCEWRKLTDFTREKMPFSGIELQHEAEFLKRDDNPWMESRTLPLSCWEIWAISLDGDSPHFHFILGVSLEYFQFPCHKVSSRWLPPTFFMTRIKPSCLLTFTRNIPRHQPRHQNQLMEIISSA